jgi:serine/threonine protein kinase
MKTVNATTAQTLQSLHTWVSGIKDDDTRIRGSRAAGDKLTTLFQRDAGKNGLLARAYNVVAGRGELRSAVNKALSETKHLARESKEAAQAIAAIKKELKNTKHDLRVGSIRSHINTLESLAGGRKEPRLDDLPGFKDSTGFHGAARILHDSAKQNVAPDLDAVADSLGKSMAASLDAAGPDAHFSFTVSHGHRFKKELSAALQESGVKLDDDAMAKLVDKTYASALASTTDRITQVATTKTHRNGRQTDEERVSHVGAFTIGGQEFTHVKKLGEGGNAVAGLYENKQTDPATGATTTRKLVLKFISPEENSKTEAQVFEEMATEAGVHRGGTQASPDDLVKFERVLRMPDGRLALVLEFAPHGDLNDFSDKLAADPQRNSPEARAMRLTLVQDALRSLEGLQTAGIGHLDLKGANLFIGEDGRARIADMGTARRGDRRHLTAPPENMVWNDPLLEHAYKPIIDKIESVRARFRAMGDKLLAKREKLFPRLKDSATQEQKDAQKARSAERDAFQTKHMTPLEARRKAEEERVKAEAGGFEVSAFAADTWSVGTLIYELYAGAPPFGKEGGLTAPMVEKQNKFMALKDHPKLREKFLFDRPGMPPVPDEIKAIIVSLLDPDPAKRISAADALKSPVFKQAGVGDRKTRDAIITYAHAPVVRMPPKAVIPDVPDVPAGG